jgi:pilus assembly protein Flp/PilA
MRLKATIPSALRLWKNRLAQDLIEYALLAGFVAVTAGALMPDVANGISTVLSTVQSVLDDAGGGSSGGHHHGG